MIQITDRCPRWTRRPADNEDLRRNANKLHFLLIDFPRDFRSERACVRLFLIIQNRNKNIFAFFPVQLACADEQR